MIKKIYILYNTVQPKVNIIIIVIIMLTLGCTVQKNYTSKYLNTEQGINLTQQDIQKIHIGMTKSEVIANIGPPILKNIFGLNTWYYIHYHDNIEKYSTHKTIELEFDLNDILTTIKIK